MTTAVAKYLASHPNAVHMKALYDYVPDSAYGGDYLSFKTGDTIVVVEKREDGWWKGLIQNTEGLFPPNYCEELPPRRVLNVDTKKASPEIKRMQSILQLKVTGTGEEIQEVEKEETPEIMTRERAQSDAHMFKVSKASSSGTPRLKSVAQRVMEGKRMLEGRMSGIDLEKDDTEVVAVDSKPAAVVRQEPTPAAKIEKPSELAEILLLKKKVSDLEVEKAEMVLDFARGKERLQDELQMRITMLTEKLEENVLIMEIMRKDLEIKTEETKEITNEMEMEIERLTQCCSDLAQQVVHLTPIPDDVLGPVHDLRSLPCIPNSRNLPTPRSAVSPSSSTRSPAPSTETPSEAAPTIPDASPPSISTESSPASTTSKAPADSIPPLNLNQDVNSKPPAPRKQVSIANLTIPSSSDSAPTADSGTPNMPRVTPRLKSMPSLGSLTRDLRATNSPRGNNSPRPQTPRIPSLLDLGLTRSDSKKNIHSFPELSAKLAEFGLTLAEMPGSTTEASSIQAKETDKDPIDKAVTEQTKTEKSEKVEKTTKAEESTPVSPPLPPLPLHASQQSLKPPVPLPDPPKQQPPQPQPQPQQTPPQLRTRSRKSKEGSSSTTKEESSVQKEESSVAKERPTRGANLNWVQASVCFAFGSLAFYVVQTLVERYNRPM